MFSVYPVFALAKVARDVGLAQQSVDMAAFVEAFVEQEFELRRIARVHPPGDFALHLRQLDRQRVLLAARALELRV